MTHEPMSLNPPPYGSGTLPDLACSLLASLRVPGEPDVLGLPRADRVCLLVVDGLGWELLREHQAAAPFLSELAAAGGPISAGFPSTTVTSLSSLGTGRPPGSTACSATRWPGRVRASCSTRLRWDPEVDPVAWQPAPTIFQRAAAAGVHASYVAASAFRGSGLTIAFARGARLPRREQPRRARGEDPGSAAFGAPATGASRWSTTATLTAPGTAYGIASDAWRYELAHVDKLAEQLATGLPEGSVFHVTADHGMVDVGPDDRVDVDAIPALREGVALLGGEAAGPACLRRARRRRRRPRRLA